jgi:serine-type D-Ala-D-Ala carboxypeptidase/endopeptidase
VYKRLASGAIALSLIVTLTSCGGGDTAGSLSPPSAPAPSPPPPPPPVTDKWAAVKAELDNFSVANAGIIIGNAQGVRLRYEKGTFKLTDTHLVASASKMMAGLTILKMVQDGQMSLTDNPQKYLPYWTTNAADPRSRITLAQLLGFVSGFNQSDTPSNCISNPNTTLQLCAQDYYNQGISSVPGASFAYGNAHLEIAGAMAEIAGGKPFSQLYRDKVANPLAIGQVSGINFPSATNPRVAGGGTSTGEEYAKMLDGVLRNQLFNASTQTTFQTDQTASVSFIFRPAAATNTGDWHYAAASWRECDSTPFNSQCAASRVISSPGLFGWTPWIDFDNGYYAIITMEGPTTTDSSPISVALEQRVQPLIVAALAAGG